MSIWFDSIALRMRLKRKDKEIMKHLLCVGDTIRIISTSTSWIAGQLTDVYELCITEITDKEIIGYYTHHPAIAKRRIYKKHLRVTDDLRIYCKVRGDYAKCRGKKGILEMYY